MTRDDVRAALDDLHEHLIDGVILIAPVVSDVMSEVNELRPGASRTSRSTPRLGRGSHLSESSRCTARSWRSTT
ncbi:MAG: hypothetical protein HND48_02630 [Chloroflexi bacterium]|nr:hypothetical protein [Chloroflexota bacterium]